MTDTELLDRLLLDNKYRRLYLAICRNRTISVLPPTKNRHHLHHILPKSLGGSNDVDNLVRLTHREHLIAHRCLTRCTLGEDRKKMVYAAWFLAYALNGSSKITSRTYDSLLSAHRDTCRLPKSAETRKRMSKPKSPKHIEHQKQAALKYWQSPNIQRVRRSGYKLSDETKRKISKSAQTRIRQPYKKRSAIWGVPINQLSALTEAATTFTELLRSLHLKVAIHTLIERLDASSIDYSHIQRGSGNHNHA